MQRNRLSFVNHASFIIENDSALLLVDPWLEGPAFNNGWSLLDQSTSSEALIARLNKAGLPVFIWFSHEHPDHFSIPFLKKFREQFRGIATFLFQHTLDKRVVGYLRKNGLDVAECKEGVPVALGHDMRITVFPYSDGDSWCLINSGGRTIVNLNDCALTTDKHCRAVKSRLDALAPRVDYLFTQFGYANWVGNPGQSSLHRAAAREKISRIALQLEHLKPRVTVPFASFVYFSATDNAYLNEQQNTPQDIVAAPALARWSHTIRFLRPGSTVDLDSDSAASLTREHELALAHWTGLLDQRARLLPAAPEVPLADIKSAFLKYRSSMAESLHGLPAALEFSRRIQPLVIHLSDLQQTVQVSYRQGWKVLQRDAAFHVAMSSNNAAFLFKNEYGFDTTQVNGRFRTAHAQALGVFSRFFLPQRMAKNGYDRRRPLHTVRYLARNALARAGRQLQTALRLS
ncbi:MBL fold metallo-hydrolase [Massilia solisilvae]|uniref:MBL fold metallo-hydrolase n=1 Tax=Massilia solisilvae TaxID=1811225 RepID=A0ABT2BQ42_9BURK|nr:MBL fold metallo-hydrolase [Massilia solisilvae]MCS0610631.1 MBL fold metallo-hydrolase [Massilia solisilvae]